ncbi:hypothetical protein [Sanyastnella coralliicola]|uniref:hypothetical protein n=1 Tax=Sanyastnella coralliicola TaxID=3069118 RepID=UPI0027B8DF46|nr:hypothetical protein [Longitalea sp. SCSIO 12813]
MKYLIAAAIFFSSITAFGQRSDNNNMAGQQRWVFGGDIALSFGTNITVIGAAPSVGYRFTERLTAGGGFLYYYYRFRDNLGEFSTSIYGPQLFGRFTAFQDLISDGDRLFLQTDFYNINTEFLQVVETDPLTVEQRRDWVPQWFVGGGYYTSIGGNVFAGLTVMWDVIGDSRAPFQSPLIRGGISFGL